jgi:hypothetical protein
MDDLDLDLIDELCSSFCTPCTSQNTNEPNTKTANESFSISNRKRTSTMNPPENSIIKKVCLSDVTNKSIIHEYDEISTLDESALQMLVTQKISMFLIFEKYFSVKNGNHDLNFHHYLIELLVFWKNTEIFNLYIVRKFEMINFSFLIGSNIDWQKKCLDLPARRKNQNLIYTLPTSGGKVIKPIHIYIDELDLFF